MSTIIPFESRLATRARLRDELALDTRARRLESPILPEHVPLEAWPRPSLIERHAWRAVGLLFVALVLLPISVKVGKVIVGLFFVAAAL